MSPVYCMCLKVKMCAKIVILLICAVTCQSVGNIDTKHNDKQFGTVEETANKMIKEGPLDLQFRKTIEDIYGLNPELLPPGSPAQPGEMMNIGQLNQNLLNDKELMKNIEDLFGSEPTAPSQPALFSSPTAYNNDRLITNRMIDPIEPQRTNLNKEILAYFGPEVGNEPNPMAVLPVSSNLTESDHDITTEPDDIYRFIDPAMFTRKYNNFKEHEKSSKEPHENNPDTVPPPPPPIEVPPPSDNHHHFAHPSRRHHSPIPSVATTTYTAGINGNLIPKREGAHVPTDATAPNTTEIAASASRPITYTPSYMNLVISCVLFFVSHL